MRKKLKKSIWGKGQKRRSDEATERRRGKTCSCCCSLRRFVAPSLRRSPSIFRLLMVLHLPPKQCRSHPHHRRAFLDREFEIVAHSHAQMLEIVAAEFVPLHLFENLARSREGV